MDKMFAVYVDYGNGRGVFPAIDDLWNYYEFDNYKDALYCAKQLQKERPNEKYFVQGSPQVNSVERNIVKLIKDNEPILTSYENSYGEGYAEGYQDALVDVLGAFGIEHNYVYFN